MPGFYSSCVIPGIVLAAGKSERMRRTKALLPIGDGDTFLLSFEGEEPAVVQAVTQELAPIRDRSEELRADRAQLEEVLAEGARKAEGIAAATLAEVREKMGVGPPG